MIVNCYVPWQHGFVMLRKPRRGWWYLPGGKVEDDELWRQAAMREFTEESGLSIKGATLRGVYRVHIEAGPDSTEKNRLIAQFVGFGAHGTLMTEHREGRLAVVTAEEFIALPMDDGDRLMVKHTMAAEQRQDQTVFFGRFSYNAEHEIQNYVIDPAGYPMHSDVTRGGDST